MNPCEIISAIRDEYPDLTRWGFWEPTQDEFETARDEMTSDHAIAEFTRAAAFLTQHCKRRRSCSSGRAEYVSNGMFIAAVIANSFKL